MQPISNTTGVALAIQYQPLMLKHERKKIQYIPLFQHINELVIKHAFLFAPEMTVWNPTLSATLVKPDQMPHSTRRLRSATAPTWTGRPRCRWTR